MCTFEVFFLLNANFYVYFEAYLFFISLANPTAVLVTNCTAGLDPVPDSGAENDACCHVIFVL